MGFGRFGPVEHTNAHLHLARIGHARNCPGVAGQLLLTETNIQPAYTPYSPSRSETTNSSKSSMSVG